MAAVAHEVPHGLEHATATGLDSRKLAIWTFIGSECLFFATLISNYLVHKQTCATARTYGLHDRGVIAPGYRADLNVIDFANLSLEPPFTVFFRTSSSAAIRSRCIRSSIRPRRCTRRACSRCSRSTSRGCPS